MFDCGPGGGGHMGKDVFYKTLPYVSIAHEVNLIGGEPTLHPSFGEYLKVLSTTASKIRLCTNGSWVRRGPGSWLPIVEASESMGDNLLVRISNDKWHREFISDKDLGKASDLLSKSGVNVVSEPMDDTPVYPLGRALSGRAWEDIKVRGVHEEPAECTKKEYSVWDNISIDKYGNIAPCFNHTVSCGNILKDSMDRVLSNIDRHMRVVLRKNPKNRGCHSCSSSRSTLGQEVHRRVEKGQTATINIQIP